MTTRRGFTMVEMMIGLILTLAVGGVTYQMLLNNQRVTRAQNEHVGVQDNVRSGALVIANELREVGYDAISAEATAELGYGPLAATRTDLLTILPGAVTYHATRGIGFVCQLSLGVPLKVVVNRLTWQELRAPKTTDSLMLYVESESNTNKDDAWLHLGITGTAAQACPNGDAGLAFSVAPPEDLALLVLQSILTNNKVVLEGPVRLTEVMRMSYWQDGGKSWLGMESRSAGTPIQPVVGPLADSTATVRGLTFDYLDADDDPTAVRADVRVIQVTLRGVTDQAVHGQRTDYSTVDTLGLTTRVALRNTLR
jgi:hypothetical protein